MGLFDARFRLLHLRTGSQQSRFASSDRGVGGSRGGSGLVELLLRNLVLVEQHAVALDIGIQFLRHGLGFHNLGLRRFDLLLRGRHAGLRAGHIGGGGANLRGRTDAGNGHAKLRRLGAGLSFLVVGLGAIERDLVVGGIGHDQHVALVHELAVIDIDLDDLSADARADGIDVSVDLGVVGALPVAAVPPVPANRTGWRQSPRRISDGLGERVPLEEAAAIVGLLNEFAVVIRLARGSMGIGLVQFVLLGASRTHLFFTCQFGCCGVGRGRSVAVGGGATTTRRPAAAACCPTNTVSPSARRCRWSGPAAPWRCCARRGWR